MAIASLALLFHVIHTAESLLQRLLRGFLFGIGKFSFGTIWLLDGMMNHAGSGRLAAILAFLMLSVLLSGLFCLACGFILRIASKISASLLFAAVLCTHEILLSFPIGFSFPLLHIGYAFIDTSIASYAPVGGVWLVGYIALLSSAAICLAFQKTFAPLLVAACLWLVSLPLGFIEWTQQDKEIKVVLVQANTSMNEESDRNQMQEVWNAHERLTLLDPTADLYVWPESAIPITLSMVQHAADEIAEKLRGSLIFGSYEHENTGLKGRTFNVAAHAGHQAATYRKQQLVPFGEYTPKLWLLSTLLEFVDYPLAHVSPGAVSNGLLPTKHAVAKVAICYEIAYPQLVNREIQESDLILALNADAWFGESMGPWQQLQIARMRARETGRYLLRVSNVGPTAILAPNGSVHKVLVPHAPDALGDTVHARTGSTMFSTLGLLPVGLVLLFSVLTALAFLYSDRTQSVSNQ